MKAETPVIKDYNAELDSQGFSIVCMSFYKRALLSVSCIIFTKLSIIIEMSECGGMLKKQ